MNSVHEPGSRTMSKNRLRNNTESIWIENRPSAPSAQPLASPRAQAAQPALPCALHALSRAPSSPACLSPRTPAVLRVALPRACRTPAARCLAPHASAACAHARALRAQLRTQRLPSLLLQWLYCNTALSSPLPSHNTIVVLRYNLPAASLPATIH